MAVLEILQFPDPRLRKTAAPVVQVDDRVRQTVDDMLETMYRAPGIGLAATQVDIHRRIIVADVSENKDQPLCLIDAELVATQGEEEMEEGCLSIPGFTELVRRAEWVKVRALDRDGTPFEVETAGLLAVCLQHEIDHINGKLFIDHLSPLKRRRILKKVEKAKKQGPEDANSDQQAG